jgi:hypothetical protein
MKRTSAAVMITGWGVERLRTAIGRTRWAPILLLALATQSGCGREFFREWANQDVSEAVFEKSRDPRWFLPLFSIEPPAMSRYADPYDPDRPPAPPDDFATQSLSPVPQWPDHRLLIPVEGTGYLDMLEAWKRLRPEPDQPKAGAASGNADQKDAYGSSGPGQPSQPPNVPPAPPVPPPSNMQPPFAPRTNLGPAGAGMSPISVPASSSSSTTQPATLAAPPTASTSQPRAAAGIRRSIPEADKRAPALQAQTRKIRKDPGVLLAAYQETGLPMPVLPPAPQPSGTPTRRPRRDLQTPEIGQDPDPQEGIDLTQPVITRPDLTPEEAREAEGKGAEMAGILITEEIHFDEAEAAGLRKGTRPYVVTIEQAFALGLINARIYQTNLENLYAAALNVTLQRFAFEPQFVAGMSPLTAAAGIGLPVNPTNQFFYTTKETGTQTSRLSLGTVAGFGKFFQSGARLITGFANQTVFNFAGSTPRQPQVQSFLPLSIVQPFLRGGGRAVALEPLTQAERSLVYALRSFAKFRQEFVVSILVGGSTPTFGTNVQSQGFSGGGAGDPVVGFLPVLQDVQQLENDRKNIAAFEQLAKVYKELIQGESSGLSQLQLDQIESSLLGARSTFVSDRVTYRNDLDQFKVQLGLPPDTPLVLDRGLTQRFKQVFDDIDKWAVRRDRDLLELDAFAKQLPDLEDIVLDGRSVLGIYPKEGEAIEDQLEELLIAAERVALENRLDLMNQRAALYDSWRQLRVTANALKGVLNVTLSNQFITPPTTTNPFAFVDQAKQFSLVFQTELPLIRVLERNTFRAALINYQRQRRTLQNVEDTLKLAIRNEIRSVQQQYLIYEINRRNFVFTIRQKDQAFENIIAPPTGAATAGNANGAVQTNNLISFQGQLLQRENTLVQQWVNYQLARLGLYRDLGILPFDEWEAFGELFPERTSSNGASAASLVPGPAGPATPHPTQGTFGP